MKRKSLFEAVNRRNFLSELRHFILFRTLQVLGAYGFRGLYEHRPHFLESIPYAMDNLRELLSAPFDEYPCLCRLLGQLIPIYSHREPRKDGRLLVRIFSFSYKTAYRRTPPATAAAMCSTAVDCPIPDGCPSTAASQASPRHRISAGLFRDRGLCP